LSAFTEQNKDLFFGREDFAEQLVTAVKRHPLVPVIGASGSGKSSVVFAGLIPRLRAEKTWLIGSFRPQSQPFYGLAFALVRIRYSELNKNQQDEQTSNLFERMQENRKLWQEVTDILKEHPGKRLLLVVDQFEELYALDKQTQKQFVDALLEAIQFNSNLKLVLTIRHEFLDYIMNYPPFNEVALQPNGHKFLGTMNREEMKSVIELIDRSSQKPIVELQDGLTERILDEVQQEPGNLPLLEFALTQLWQESGGGKLTYLAYDKIGGVTKALTNHADKIYEKLDNNEKKQVKEIFLKLIRLGEKAEDISDSELATAAEKDQVGEKAKDIAEKDRVQAQSRFVVMDTRQLATRSQIGEDNWKLVKKLAGVDRDIPEKEKKLPLLVTGRNQKTGEQTVEVVHEALIREWKELQEWIKTDRTFRTWQQRLSSSMRQWKNNKNDRGALLRGSLLEEAKEKLDTHFNDLSNDEKKYIERSWSYKKLKEVISFLLLVGTATLFAISYLSFSQAKEAQDGTKLEQAGVNALFQFKSGELSSLVSAMQSTQDLQKLIGNRNNPKDYPAVSPILALQKILDDIHEKNYFEAGQGEVKSAVFLPGDKGFITAGEGKENKEDTLQIWNLAGKEEASLKGHKGGLLSGVNAVSVGGNAQNPVIASAGEDGTVRLWDKLGNQIRQLIAKGESFSAIAVSLDGQKIIAGQRNGTVYMWDKSGKQLLKTWAAHGSYVTAISFSKNGQTLATTGNDGLARIWTVTGNKLGELKHPQIKRMLGVSLSPDGKFVATASDDNRARIWTVNGQEVRRLEGHQGSVTVVNFSPDGQSVATGSVDGSVKLWDAKTGQNLQDFRGHRGVILSASFSADGKRLVSIAKDKFVRLWNLADTPVQRLELTGFKDDVNAIAFSPDGKTVAGAGNEGVMRQWDATSGKELKVWKEAIQRTFYSQNKVQDIAFSPDGKFIVAGGLRIGIARVWDLAGSLTEPKVRLKGNEDKPEAHRGDIVSVAFSPNRQLIATTGSYDKTMRIWNPKSPNGELVAKTEPQEKEMSRVLFIPGENQIVTGDGNGNVAIWDLAAKQISKWKVHSTQIRGLGITPDRSQIVTADKTGTVKISDRSGNKPKEFFSYQSGINELAISPNGKLIATGGMDGTVRLWDFHGRQVAEFRNPKGSIWAIAFSPDSQRIALAGNNGFVTIRRIDSLSDLMKNGCTWLQDYLALHPSEKNSLCP